MRTAVLRQDTGREGFNNAIVIVRAISFADPRFSEQIVHNNYYYY